MNVAIIGAGVAGLASAIALNQKGYNVQIYERRASPSTLGAGIVVWPNAAFVLDQLGLLDRIASRSGKPVAMQRYTQQGEKLGRIDFDILNRAMGYDTYSILRRDFHGVLLDYATELRVPIHYSHGVDRYSEQSNQHVVVEFSNATKINPDLIIAADGRMNSIARRFVAGNNTPIYQHCVNWIGVFESHKRTFDSIEVSDYWGVGERFGIVPVSPYQAYWAGGAAEKNIGERNPGKYLYELLDRFSNWPEPIPTIIRQSDTTSLNKIYLHDLDPMQRWHRGNLVVIGDAAHAALPTSGQGACQALEDAWHLTNCLTQFPHDLQPAFAQISEIRLQKITSIIHAARNFASSIFNVDVDYCRKRNDASRDTSNAVAISIADFWKQGLPLKSNI